MGVGGDVGVEDVGGIGGRRFVGGGDEEGPVEGLGGGG